MIIRILLGSSFGKKAEAYQELKPMNLRVVKAGDFYEWWSRDNQPRGSAGVLAIANEQLLSWARANP